MKKLLKCYYHVKIIEEEGKGDELDANLYNNTENRRKLLINK